MEEEYSWELLAGKGQIPAVITINTDRYGEIQKTCNSNHFITFHEGARIVFITEYVSGNSEIFENMTALVDVQRKFETLFKGYFLEVGSDINPTIKEGVLCTCVVRKCKAEDLEVSNDYTLVRDKMDIVEDIRTQVAEQDFINFLQDFLKDKTAEEKEELLNTKSIIWFREEYRKIVK